MPTFKRMVQSGFTRALGIFSMPVYDQRDPNARAFDSKPRALVSNPGMNPGMMRKKKPIIRIFLHCNMKYKVKKISGIPGIIKLINQKLINWVI